MSSRVIKMPASTEELADIVAQASRTKTTIEIIGSATKRAIGHVVDADIDVKMSRLSGILDYTPSELVMTAKAGTPLRQVQTELAKNNQMLAFEPADYSSLLGLSSPSGLSQTDNQQTIGGIFATNLSGPRRLSAGAARDALLGVKFVNGIGQIVKSGGKVMKNVTGLDLVKLLAGSWGTLGIMSEVTFKVLPMPETVKTILISGLSDKEAISIMSLALAQTVEVSSAAHLPKSVSGKFLSGNLAPGAITAAITALRLEGLQSSVIERENRLSAALSGHHKQTVLDQEQSDILWREISDVKPFCDRFDSAIWKISIAPSIAHQLLADLRQHYSFDAYYDWQGGLVWLSMDNHYNADLLRQIIKKLGGGHATLIRGSQEERRSIAVFEPQSPTLTALFMRIKQQMDPYHILNPSRMLLDKATKQVFVL